MLRDVVFKHFLFDVEMFAHVNVSGVMSGALTTGDKLTGETSGATGIIESTTTEGSATITDITRAQPAVVTCSGGHNFTDGQVITISGVTSFRDQGDGVTPASIDGNHIVKNPTATTFELFNDAPGSLQLTPINTTVSPNAYSSGGTAKHTTIVLSDIQRRICCWGNNFCTN